MKFTRRFAGLVTLLGLLLLVVGGCGKSSPAKPVSPAPPGLEYRDLAIGTGPEAVRGSYLAVDYVGRFVDGTEFDNSIERGQPFKFKLGVGEVIKGWDEGIPGMRVGGKRLLTIPPSLAYGSRGAGNFIPPNATLQFEVTLIAVRKTR